MQAPGIPTGSTVSPSHMLVTALDRSMRKLLRALEGLPAGDDQEVVHDLRVAARRLLAVLDVVLPFARPKSARRVRDQVQRLLKGLNAVRDAEIACAEITALAKRYPGMKSLAVGLARRRGALRRDALRACRRFDHAAAVTVHGVLRSMLLASGRTPGREEVLLRIILGALALRALRVEDRRAALNKGNPATYHRLRIAIKKARYLTEVVAPLLGDDADRRVHELRVLQTALGRLQDLAVVGACLAVRPPGGWPERDLEQVRRLLARRRTECIAAIEQLLPTLDWKIP